MNDDTKILVGILGRISKDEDGDAESGDQHVVECQEYVQLHMPNAVVVDIYDDRNVSGYDEKAQAKREQYIRLQGDLRSGRINHVIFWKLDRLGRLGVVGAAKFIELLRETGANFTSVQEPYLKIGDAMSEGIFTFMAAMARQESENNSRRQLAAKRRLAQQGAPRQRSFGFSCCRGISDKGEPTKCKVVGCTHDGEPIPHERDLIIDAVDRILAGTSRYAIIREWNDKDIRTVFGNPWEIHTLTNTLTNKKLIGLLEHNGEYDGKRQTKVTKGIWTPILDVETFQRLQVVLETKTPYRQLRQKASGRYLLSGILRCGKCGEIMYAGRKDSYQCPKSMRRACGQITIAMHHADHTIRAKVLDILTNVHPPTSTDIDPTPEREAYEDAKRRRAHLLDALYTFGTVSIEDGEKRLTRLNDEVTRREQALQAAQRTAEESEAPKLPYGDRDALEAHWNGLSVSERADLVRWLMRDVRILPGKPGRNFDPRRVEVTASMHYLRQVTEGMTDDQVEDVLTDLRVRGVHVQTDELAA